MVGCPWSWLTLVLLQSLDLFGALLLIMGIRTIRQRRLYITCNLKTQKIPPMLTPTGCNVFVGNTIIPSFNTVWCIGNRVGYWSIRLLNHVEMLLTYTFYHYQCNKLTNLHLRTYHSKYTTISLISQHALRNREYWVEPVQEPPVQEDLVICLLHR